MVGRQIDEFARSTVGAVAAVPAAEQQVLGGTGDARITCVACHDPHQQLEKRSETYERKCLACHAYGKNEAATAMPAGKACPVATSKCSSCHMPKIEISEMHYAFTDHDIRVSPGRKTVA
jgi:formate-dependent nitrite reductase cytochrome c552 subunit